VPEPLLSIVTPSLNQATWVRACLESVAREASEAQHTLGLNPGAIEHLIMDGGSTDDSARIIADHADRHPDLVTHWVSSPDEGQSDAINRGLEHARGRFATWLNADDWYEPGGLAAWIRAIIEADENEPRADVVVGRCRFVDETGATVWDPTPPEPMNAANFLRLRSQWFNARMIVQPEACFRLSAFRAIGGLNIDNHHSMDHELWIDLAREGCRFVSIDARIACLRVHAGQKSADNRAVVRSMLATGKRVLREGQAHALGEELADVLADVQGELEAVATKLRVADALIARFDLVREKKRGTRHEALGTGQEEEKASGIGHRASGIGNVTKNAGEGGPSASAGSLASGTHQPPDQPPHQPPGQQRLQNAMRTLAEPHTRKALKLAAKHVGKRVRICAHTSDPISPISPAAPASPTAPTVLDTALRRTFRTLTPVDERADIAVLDNVLVHEPNPADVIQSLWHSLRPGGVLIVLNELVPAPGLLDYLASLERHLCNHLAANNDLILHPEADGWVEEGMRHKALGTGEECGGTRHWALGTGQEEGEEGSGDQASGIGKEVARTGLGGPSASAGSLDARAWLSHHPSCLGTDIAAIVSQIAPDAQSLMHRRHGSYWFHPAAPFPFVPGVVPGIVTEAGVERPITQEDTRLTAVWRKATGSVESPNRPLRSVATPS
jgi:Glycosyl transferase family 2